MKCKNYHLASYYFIKYNQFTNLNHINKYAQTNAIICFDFEDSIKNSQEKILHRNYFKVILNEIIPKANSIKIGVRLNADNNELQKDIETLKNQKIYSILIPKVENSEQIRAIEKKLIHNNIDFEELIPIIESSDGLKNLSKLIRDAPKRVKKIGFGHCDYNLSIKSLPFFHQNTTQYWKWIKGFSKILKAKDISFINSAYLDLANLDFFKSMLENLQGIFGANCSQFCLTSKQSLLVKNFSKLEPHQNFELLLNNCYDLTLSSNFIEGIISEFEQDSFNRNFAISKQTNSLISPQEYKMGLNGHFLG